MPPISRWSATCHLRLVFNWCWRRSSLSLHRCQWCHCDDSSPPCHHHQLMKTHLSVNCKKQSNQIFYITKVWNEKSPIVPSFQVNPRRWLSSWSRGAKLLGGWTPYQTNRLIQNCLLITNRASHIVTSLIFCIRRLSYHSNETLALIADPSNNAQLGSNPHHFPKLHPGTCSSVGMRRGTDRHTQAGMTNIHFARLCLMQNFNFVLILVNESEFGSLTTNFVFVNRKTLPTRHTY